MKDSTKNILITLLAIGNILNLYNYYRERNNTKKQAAIYEKLLDKKDDTISQLLEERRLCDQANSLWQKVTQERDSDIVFYRSMLKELGVTFK